MGVETSITRQDSTVTTNVVEIGAVSAPAVRQETVVTAQITEDGSVAVQVQRTDTTTQIVAEAVLGVSASVSKQETSLHMDVADYGLTNGGDMHTFIYDPTGIHDDVFNLGVHYGVLDCGEFF